ncbi:LacI family DNA-binding transcriptional regulator, partial [Sinorhizobium medicae]
MRPTVHDIAAEAGVSLATVDRVLNNRPGVRSVTRNRVERAIATLGYVRDVAAANLAKSRSYPLVFILPSGENAFMRGLESELRFAMSRSAAE